MLILLHCRGDLAPREPLCNRTVEGTFFTGRLDCLCEDGFARSWTCGSKSRDIGGVSPKWNFSKVEFLVQTSFPRIFYDAEKYIYFLALGQTCRVHPSFVHARWDEGRISIWLHETDKPIC